MKGNASACRLLWLVVLLASSIATAGTADVNRATSALDAAIVGDEKPRSNVRQVDQADAEFLAAALSAPGGGGTEPIDLPSEDVLARLRVKDEVSPETTDLLGEQIDLNNGGLSFLQTDIAIPGNSALPVALSRSYRGGRYTLKRELQFGDWQLDVPYVNTTLLNNGTRYSGSWGIGKECSGSLEPGPIMSFGNAISSHEYWNGDTLHVPGMVDSKLLETPTGTAFSRVSKGNWRVSCYPRSGGAGEGFLAHGPNGIKVYLDVLRLVNAGALIKDFKPVPRYHAFMLASKIEDRFGNWVKYNYVGTQLTSISASDGRSISFYYNDDSFSHTIDRAVANGKTWTYQYQRDSYGHPLLQYVIRPDGKRWTFSLAGIDKEPTKEEPHMTAPSDERGIWGDCDGWANSASGSGWLQHPNGVKGTFAVAQIIHGRTEVPDTYSRSAGVHKQPKCYATVAVVSKVLTGPQLSSLGWQYAYSENAGAFIGETKPVVAGLAVSGYDAGDLKTTTVTAPDGSRTRHIFNRRWNYLDGAEVAVEYYDSNGSSLLKRVENGFAEGGNIGGTAEMFLENNAQHEKRRDLIQERVKTYVNGALANTYTTDYSNFNSYGVPQLTHEYNSFSSAARWTRTSYQHDTTQWLLNLPTKTELSDNGSSFTTVSETVYYPAASYGCTSCGNNLQPRYQKRFGATVKTFESYHPDGNLQKLNFGLSSRWQRLDNYKRGKAQTITLPARYASCTIGSNCPQASLVVNDDGTVASVTDFNANKTSYGYDSLGRLALINPLDSRWSNTVIAYSDGANGELLQTTSRGNYEKVTHFDALLRPILVAERDISLPGSERYTVSRFNAYNKPVFQSFASTSAFEAQGSTFEYDGLQRLTAVISTVDGSATRTSYLGGNQLEVTNPRHAVTTTSYLAYGTPEQSQPLVIRSPENVTTTLQYNLFGNVTSISQGGVTESRLYDSYQYLCKTIRPETNQTLSKSSAWGDLLWSVEGVSGSTSACETSTSASNRVIYGYDNQGALQSLDYADATPDVLYTRDNQGNLTVLRTGTLVSGAIAAPSASNSHSQWAYAYNSANLVETETLSLDGLSFTLDPSYNALGQLSSLKYPSNRSYAFAPNALGQPSQAGSYASAALYHPNGLLKSFRYGNGLSFSQSLDSERRPDLRTVGSGSSKVEFNYGYDANNNINSLVDTVNPAYSLSGFNYDELDRLKNVTGNWGVGSFTYDSLSNLKNQTLGGSSVTYNYATSNKLGSLSGGLSKSFGYDNRGNLTSLNGITLTFNAANELTAGNGASYRYDGHHRQIKKVSGSNTSYSLYNQAGELLYRHVNGTGTDYLKLGAQLIAEVSGSTATVSYQHTDLLGSTVAESNSSGTITARYHYQPFGQRIESYTADDLGYTGHQHDSTLGLTYAQARYLDQSVGRFLSNDPKGFDASNVQSFNRYAYGNNNPYKYVDPNGQSAITWSEFGGRIGSKALVALADGPEPGVADVIAVGMIVVEIGVIGYEVMHNEEVTTEEGDGEKSPEIKPEEIAGKKPDEIDKTAREKGLIPKGNDPKNGKGSYVDPVTGKQRVLSHPDADCGPHCHVNNSEGERLDKDGNVVPPESPEAHLPLGQ